MLIVFHISLVLYNLSVIRFPWAVSFCKIFIFYARFCSGFVAEHPVGPVWTWFIRMKSSLYSLHRRKCHKNQFRKFRVKGGFVKLYSLLFRSDTYGIDSNVINFSSSSSDEYRYRL